MAINDEELLAAVSGGVDTATPAAAQASAPTEEPNDDDTNEPDGAAADGGADDAAGGEGDGDAGADGDADGDSDAAADGSAEPERGPDGKPIAKPAKKPADEVDPATGQPYTPEALAAKKADEEKEAFRKLQVEDPINAPIPKYLKDTTQKRMTKLVEIAKDLTAKHTAAQNDRNEIIGMITDTGATATQYTSALSYLKMVNSRDPVQIKQAISVMQAELTALSRMAGVAVPGVDHLANHPDLKAAIEAKQLTQALAEEIAARREQSQHQDTASRAATQTREQLQAEHNAGVTALNAVGQRLKGDPGYAAKTKAVLAKIGDQMRASPPSQWAQIFLTEYATYQAPRQQTPAVRKVAVVPKNQPLRGNNPSGGQQNAPKSLEDAINMGIAAGTRR